MTDIEVITAANDSGLTIYGLGKDRAKFLHHLEHFAALVAAHEREACAMLAEETICDVHIPTNVKIYGSRAGNAIRARGTT